MLISGSAYASGTGYAVGTNSTANGPGSYATSINGVATWHNAIATGEGMSREQFTERRKVVEAIERQLGEKQTEINTIDAQISSVQSLIDSIERRITDINQRQEEIAPLLEQRTILQNQRDEAQTRLAEQQKQLQQANNAYNRLSKDSNGNSIYINYDNILNGLNWNKLGASGNGRDKLTADIKTIIETDFPELKGTFTDLQYKELINGYIARKSTADVTARYLDSVINKHISEKNQIKEQLRSEMYRLIFQSSDDLKVPNKLPTFGEKDLSRMAARIYYGYSSVAEKERYIKDFKPILYYYFSEQKDGTNAHILRNNYTANGYQGLMRMPPINKKINEDLLFND